MALKVENEHDIDINDYSLENSADSDLLGMVDEGSCGSADDRQQLVSQQYTAVNAGIVNDDTTYCFKDLTGNVTYKIVHMGEDISNGVTTNSPSHGIQNAEYYVIGEPLEILGSSPKKAVRKTQTLQAKAVTTKKRDDKRRATHNEVERRRRDKINSWITKLAALVPTAGLPDSNSKGGILAKACDHITELTEKQKKLEKLEGDNQKLVMEVLRLNKELAELRKENSSMRSQLADTCIVQRPKGQKS